MHPNYNSSVNASASWFSRGYLKDDPLRQSRRKRSKPRQINTPGRSFVLDFDDLLRHCGQEKKERQSPLKVSDAKVYIFSRYQHARREGYHRLPRNTISERCGMCEESARQARKRAAYLDTKCVPHFDKPGQTITEAQFILPEQRGKRLIAVPFWFVDEVLPEIKTASQLLVALFMLRRIGAGHKQSFSTSELRAETGLKRNRLAAVLKSPAFRKLKHGVWAIIRRKDTCPNLLTLTDSEKGPQVGKVNSNRHTVGISDLVVTLTPGSTGETPNGVSPPLRPDGLAEHSAKSAEEELCERGVRGKAA